MYRVSVETTTQASLHMKPSLKISQQAESYIKRYNVQIKIHNPNSKKGQNASADAASIFQLMSMAVGPESKLEIIVSGEPKEENLCEGESPEEFLKRIAYGMADVISMKYS